MLIGDMMDFTSPPPSQLQAIKPRMKVAGVFVALGILIISVGVGLVWRQTQTARQQKALLPKGVVTGRVVDQHQAVVGDVELVIVSADTHQTVTKTHTAPNGSYKTTLQPGVYRIIVRVGDFETSKTIQVIQNGNEKSDIQVIRP
jgi:Carboxypeptidase regulatory-like domain